jgi:2-oxoglutarate-Fe(II)-dependent dioxygenase family protein
MKILELNNKNVDYKNYIKRSAKESDYDTLITESCIGIENGEIKFVYQELDLDCSEIVEALKRIKYSENERSSGLITRSRVFGFKPRVTFRSDFCSTASLAHDFPKEHKIVCDFAKTIEQYYRDLNPRKYEEHKTMTQTKVKDAFHIPNSIFTSGIINKNNPLKYHFDTGNYKEVFSCMPVFKKAVAGGHLALPEYGIGIELKNNSLFMFDGQSILHGVTPIKYLDPVNGYRFSVVYYSLMQMWKCLEIDDELARIRNKRVERERMRANPTEEHLSKLKKQYAGRRKRNEKIENSARSPK